MTFPRVILAACLLALAAAAPGAPARAQPPAAHSDYDTQWLRERHEERLEEAREKRNERTRRDPRRPLYNPGAGPVRPTPQNPLAPIPKGKRPWNIGP